MAESTLLARSPFEGLAAAPAGGLITVLDRVGLELASVLVRRGQEAALAARVKETLGINLPRGPRRSQGGAIAFAGTGPEAWLASREPGSKGFAASLKQHIGQYASIVDQSDGYAVLRVTGEKIRDVLAKGVSLDLHERSFRIGDVAVTVVFHIGATIWRLDDADGLAVFEIAVFRSLAGSFWHWLAESSAEFGLSIADAARV